MAPKLLRVSAKHFVAAVDINGIVNRAAPILKWAVGLTEAEFRKRCRLKAWSIEEIPLRPINETD